MTDDEYPWFEALRTLFDFVDWLGGRESFYRDTAARLHPWTFLELRSRSDNRHHLGPLWPVEGKDWKLHDFLVEQDDRIPPGIIRLKRNGGDETVDVPMFPWTHHLHERGMGGFCFASARCMVCDWKARIAEGTLYDDAFRAAAFFAREHRAQTGHIVEVEARISYVGEYRPAEPEENP